MRRETCGEWALRILILLVSSVFCGVCLGSIILLVTGKNELAALIGGLIVAFMAFIGLCFADAAGR